jgi:hypothetical protein
VGLGGKQGLNWRLLIFLHLEVVRELKHRATRVAENFENPSGTAV